MKHDITEIACGAIVQHGKYNDRVYLMDSRGADSRVLVPCLVKMAETNGYTKIFAKVHHNDWSSFRDAGFCQEAIVPGFYNGGEDAVFGAYYLDKQRSFCENADHLVDVLDQARGRGSASPRRSSEDRLGLKVRVCVEKDAEHIAAVYDEVFTSYPFPVNNPEYIRQTMKANYIYVCVEEDGVLCALASTDFDRKGGNAEMTDFATIPDYRGRGFASDLLSHMENLIAAKGCLTVFTICRAESVAINKVFAGHSYEYAGTLINNTNIAGHIESMNVWYKHLSADS